MGKSEMLTIPTLHDSPFSWLELSFTVQFEDVPKFDNRDGESYAKARLDAFSGGELCEPRHLQAITEPPRQRITLDQTNDERGYHVSLGISTDVSSEPTDFVVRETMSAEYLLRSLHWYENLPGSVRTVAWFSVKRDELPPDGNISSMIGVTLEAGDEEVLITGAEWMPRAFPGDTISWSLYRNYGDDAEIVAGKIVRRTNENLHDAILSDAFYLATTRYNRFILQREGRGNAIGA
jgi:hypothetical protein